MPRQPSVVDKHVGARLRAARLEAGKSQTDVAEALGVTFQQVQKYEKGTNRISAGRLYELSRLFDVPVQSFLMASAVSRAGAANKHVAGFDPLTHFRGLRLHHEREESGNGIRENGFDGSRGTWKPASAPFCASRTN